MSSPIVEEPRVAEEQPKAEEEAVEMDEQHLEVDEFDVPTTQRRRQRGEVCHVVSSDWEASTSAKPGTSVTLTLALDKPVEEPTRLVLLKDGRAEALLCDANKCAIDVCATTNSDVVVVVVELCELSASDTGHYTLALKEDDDSDVYRPLVATALFVVEEEKEKEKEQEQTLVLREDDQPLVSTQLTKPTSEVVVVKDKRPPSVVSCDWQAQTHAKQGESIALSLCLDKPVDEAHARIELRKADTTNNNKQENNARTTIETSVREDGTCDVVVKMSELEAGDTGRYSLVVAAAPAAARDDDDETEIVEEVETVTLVETELIVEVIEEVIDDDEVAAEERIRLLSSNWLPRMCVEHGESVTLSLSLSRALRDHESFRVCRRQDGEEEEVKFDGERVALSTACIDDDDNTSVLFNVTIKMNELSESDAAAYSFVVSTTRHKVNGDEDIEEETTLVSTQLVVEPAIVKPVEVSVLASDWQPLVALKQGESIAFTMQVELSSVAAAAAADVAQMFALCKNGQVLAAADSNSKASIQVQPSDQKICDVSVTLSDVQPDDSAEYTLVFLAPNNSNEEPLAKCQLDVAPTPMKHVAQVVASDWQPETTVVVKRDETTPQLVLLSLVLDTPVTADALQLVVNGEPRAIAPPHEIEISACDAGQADGATRVTLTLAEPTPADYALVLVAAAEDEPRQLAATRLNVEKEATPPPQPPPRVVSCDWQAETKCQHGESLTLSLCLDKPIGEQEQVATTLALYKDGSDTPISIDQLKCVVRVEPSPEDKR